MHRLRLDDRGRFALAAPPLRLPPGSGPRHAALVDGLLVVVLELTAQIWVGRRTPGGWTEWQVLPASTAPGPSFPSGIATDGRRTVVANRGPDSLTELGRLGDQLIPVAERPSGGLTPRDVLVAGGHLWVSNQGSNEVTVLPVTDLSLPALRLPIATPTSVALIPGNRTRVGR